MTTTKQQWLTTRQVGRRLGRSRGSVRRLLDTDADRPEGRKWFPGAYRMPGGHWRIPAEAVDKFLVTLGVTRRKKHQTHQTHQTHQLSCLKP